MSRVVAIIQARMNSTRLPGKVLMDIAGRPMLERVVMRASRARTVDDLVVATSSAASDQAVAAFCTAHDIACFRGSEEDVLDRFFHAARQQSAEVVVRITGDCPLIDPAVIDRCVACFQPGHYDYVSNLLIPTFPDGLDVETFSFAALERAWREARWQSEREHVTPYIRNHPELFRIGNLLSDIDYSAFRWTVDEEEDLSFVRNVYEAMDTDAFGLYEVLALLRQRPSLDPRESPARRNEGFAKSIREDRLL